MIVLSCSWQRTKTGSSMRAVAEDREIASLMGIDVDRVVVTTFIIGGMLAGIAGVLYALTFGQVSATMGFLPGIAAFTAAVLGGIGSVPGAALGGLHARRRRVRRPVPAADAACTCRHRSS